MKSTSLSKLSAIGGVKKRYKMTTVLIKKYNPLEMSREDVLALATGREKLLDIMLAEMKVCLKEGSNQHFVLHGPRGIGKSFFTRLLKIHHDQSHEFKSSLFLQLPEEQENINFAADLLDVISTLLEGGKLIDTAPKWTISDMQWQKSKQRLREAIDEIKKNGKRHVFVTQENLQVFIPGLDKLESSRLREFLSDFDEVTIIGSSLRPDLDNDYSKRLFQVFKKLDMEPWTEDDFLTYYDKLAQLSNYDKEQLENLKKSKNKIKAISQFTGGSPRLAVILSKLILEKNILDTAQLLDGIIDELTTYYQDITNDIPSKSKILFDMLIRKGENMTQSTLAAAFEPPLEQKDIARSFAWLTDNYYVISSKQNKGNTKYFYVRDRMYVLYYQKRQVYADMPFSFVGVFVDFLNAFYSQREKIEELEGLDLKHAYALPVLSILAEKEGLCMESYEQNASLIRDKLFLKYNDSHSRKLSSSQLNKRRKITEFFEKGNTYFEKGDYENAMKAYNKSIDLNPEVPEVYNNLGNTFMKRGEFEKAISTYEKAIDLNPGIAYAYNNLAIAFDKIGNYGHMKRKWNPKMLPYIFMERKGNQILDLNRTAECLDKAAFAMKQMAKSGKKILFVATKKQAKDIVASAALSCEMPYVTERWIGGMMTNFSSIRKLVKKMNSIEKMLNDPAVSITKEERLTLSREKDKLERELGGIANLNRLPSAVFMVDIHHEHIALAEAKRLGVKTIAMVNINSDPNKVDFPIPFNDDESNSEKLITDYVVSAIKEGLKERRLSKVETKVDNKKDISSNEKTIQLNPEYADAYNNLKSTYAQKGEYEKAISTLLMGLNSNVDDPGLITMGLRTIIKHQQWQYLVQFHDQWKGDKPFSSLLGDALHRVIKENQNNKFYYFKNTFDSIRNFSFININEVINGLCIGLYKDGDVDFLRQVVDELSHDFANDTFVKINLDVYRYLLNPEEMDINQLHPDVRTVVNSILKEI